MVPLRAAAGELVMLQREMVEPDRGIAMGIEFALDGGGLVIAGVDAGKLGIVDHLLVLLEPRHMGIAEDRDAVGLQLRRLLRGLRDAVHRLGGEAVHEVEVHRGEARLAQELVGGLDEAEGLQPVDLHLHRRGEILHAEADAVEAHAGQHPGAFARQRAGIGFERHLAAGGEAEALVDGLDDLADVQVIEIGGRAAAEVEMGDLALAAAEERGRAPDVLHQIFDVARRAVIAVGHRGVAAAIPAELAAEGDVDIDREGGLRVQRHQPVIGRLRRESRDWNCTAVG